MTIKFIAEIETEAELLAEHLKALFERHPNATVTINPKAPTTVLHVHPHGPGGTATDGHGHPKP